MDKVYVTGMVLSATPQGEYDKRVVILTRERGKITAFARGARKQHSSLIGATNPFVYGKFQVYEGRNSYTLVGAEIENYFPYFSTNLKEAYLGFYFLEFMNFYTHENNDEYDNLKLLYCALVAISDGKHDMEIVRAAFKWKYLVINGICPNVNICYKCGKEADKGEFDFSYYNQSIVCRQCGGSKSGIKLFASTLYTLQYLIYSNIKETFSFNLSPEIKGNFIALVDTYYEKFYPHKFSAYDMYITV